MLTVDLNAISDLLDKALDLDASAREPWLATLAQTEPDLAAKLRALLSRQGELETDQLLIDGGRSLKPEVLAKATEDHTEARAQFVLRAGAARDRFAPQGVHISASLRQGHPWLPHGSARQSPAHQCR